MTEKMVHRRIISLEGDAKWVKTTLLNSLPEGINEKYFGEGRLIRVETIKGDPLESRTALACKPEKRFEEKGKNLAKEVEKDLRGTKWEIIANLKNFKENAYELAQELFKQWELSQILKRELKINNQPEPTIHEGHNQW